MASQNPFPLMPPKSTELRLMHFDEYAYAGTPDTILFKLVDALCGTTGAGALLNEIFLARMGGALETIYFNDLDFIFSKINFLSRSPAESYPYNPMVDQLTSEQWSEVRVKDSWYRDRIKKFFQACTLGSTPDGLRMTVDAAIGTDADVYEVWRYLDNFGITASLGRSPFSARNEVVVRPHKDALLPEELRLLRDMLTKVASIDTIVTVNLLGLAMYSPLTVAAAAADSTYFEVQKMVLATPVLDQLPAPELLPIDLLPSETWLYLAKTDPVLAPYTAFNISCEFGYFYLVGGGRRSPIDSVTYGTMDSTASDPMSTYKTENNFQTFDSTGDYTDKKPWDRCDSPDNWPGGRFGIHPDHEPALNSDGTPYIFRFASQTAYVILKIAEILGLGGLADHDGYRLPIHPPSASAHTYWPSYAISYFPPAKESTVTTSCTRRRYSGDHTAELRDPINFVRR